MQLMVRVRRTLPYQMLLAGVVLLIVVAYMPSANRWHVIGSQPLSSTDMPAPTPLAPQFPRMLERATVNAPDIHDGPLVHVVYLVPRDREDERYDRLGLIENMSRAIQSWLLRQGGIQLRLDLRPSRVTPDRLATDVTFIRSDRSAAELSDPKEVEHELAKRSDLSDDRYKLLVLTPGEPDGPYCGATAGNPVDDEYAPATVFLDADPRCGTRSFSADGVTASWAEHVALHELLHTLGAVDELAPRYCVQPIGHVCLTKATASKQTAAIDPEAADLMWPYITAPLEDRLLDRQRDDYFAHDMPGISDVRDSPWISTVGADDEDG